MKKYILALAVVLNGSFIMAQTEFDALKLIQTDINGTARYMGMAGAFGALGGDASAIKDNPAGLGIYRTSEMTGTLNVSLQNSDAAWVNTSAKDNLTNTNFTNFSYVKAMSTYRSQNSNSGLLNSNWSFSYNKLKSFNRSSTIQSNSSASSMTDYMASFTNGIDEAILQTEKDPYNNQNIPWISILAYQGYLINPVSNSNWNTILPNNQLVAPSYSFTERGAINEYSIGWSGNFSNKIYLGATINLRSIDYTSTSSYSESLGTNQSMNLRNTISTTGSGVNLNLGVIVRPTDFLRLGLAFHTPTIYSLNDNYNSYLNYNVKDINGVSKTGNLTTPDGAYNEFALMEPIQVNLSGALIVGKKGLISVEYVYNNYDRAKLMDSNYDTQNYTNDNLRISTNLKNGSTIKVGGEYKITDNFSLRAGFAYMSSETKSDAYKRMINNTVRTDPEYFLNNSTQYFTGGIGYREASWYVDLAYVNKRLDETFYPYDSSYLVDGRKASPASVITTNSNLLMTIGFRF